MRQLLATAAFFYCVGTISAQTPEKFEVASIRRNISGSRPWLVPPAGGRFTATNVTLKMLIGLGWPGKLTGGPAWVGTDGYDVSAKEPRPDSGRDEFSRMMRNLLEDRFRLRVHSETRVASVYALRPAKNGLKLSESRPEPCVYGETVAPGSQAGCGAMSLTPESITNERVSMKWLAGVLSGLVGRPVLDETGFAGSFKLNLQFAPVTPDADTDGSKPSIFRAVEDQLGLILEPRKGTQDVVVIDHVERPSEN